MSSARDTLRASRCARSIAQSPDFNTNDLALFRALDVSVRKLRRGSDNIWDKEQLVADVLKMHADTRLLHRAA